MEKTTKRLIWSFIISFVVGLMAIIPMICSIKGTELNSMTIFTITLTFLLAFLCCLYLSLYIVVSQGQIETEKEEFAKNWYKAKERVIRDYPLSSDAYTQVYYLNNFTQSSENFEMLKIIAQNPECKFYAKLIENEEIELIFKDKNEQIIYEKIICNFIYFEKYFAA